MRPIAFAAAAAVLFAPVPAEAVRVWIDAGASADGIGAALVREAGVELSVAADADVLVRAGPGELSVTARGGDVLLSRRLDPELAAAARERVIVLLVSELLEQQQSSATSSVAEEIARAPGAAGAAASATGGAGASAERTRSPSAASAAPGGAGAADSAMSGVAEGIAGASGGTGASAVATSGVEDGIARASGAARAAPGAAGAGATASPSAALGSPGERSSAGAMRVSLGLAGALWARPVTPELGAYVAVHALVTERLALGGRVAVAGLGCCTVVAADVAEARQTALGLAADGEYVLLRAGAIAIAATAAAGAIWRSAEVSSLAFAGPGPREPKRRLEGMLRVGAALAYTWGSVRVRFAGGVEGRLFRLAVDLPAPYATEEVALDSGPVTGWLELGAGLELF